MALAMKKRQFGIVAIIFQIVFIVLFALFGRYSKNALPEGSASSSYVNTNYPDQFFPTVFQDIHVMILIGFGFLMTFLKRYGFSAISINLLLTAFVIQWALIMRGFLSKTFSQEGYFEISITELMTANFSAAVILISMGALLGKLSPVQYLVMGCFETTLSVFIEHVVIEYMHVNDIGGSMVVHAFGAYFGLAVAKVLSRKSIFEHENEGSVYHSDLFSMIGTMFLWVFWPSFNAALATPEDARFRAIINTYMSMASCTVVVFLISSLIDEKGRFQMVHVQNSTLAGGVAIGTVANIVLYPYQAIVIGAVAAIISVIGFSFITPKMASKFDLHDTCGVNNLHGLPAILAALFSVILVFIYDPKTYGDSLYNIYPQWEGGPDGGVRTQTSQALFQLAGLGVVLAGSILGGLLTGLFLRIPLWNQVIEKELFADGDNFHTPEDYDFTTKIVTRIDNIELMEERTALHSSQV